MCNLRGDIHVFLFDYFHVSQIKVQTFLLARKIIRNSRSFCYSTQLHSSHRIHPATHHRTRITVHQFLTTNSSKGFYINKKKPTIYDLPQNQKQPIQEFVFNKRIHKHRLYIDSSAYLRTNNSTNHGNLQTSKHLSLKYINFYSSQYIL